MAIGQLGPLGNLEFGESLSETTPPFLSGQTPAPGATGVLVGAHVLFTFDDADSGALLSSVIVTINSGAGFVTAYTGGAFQTGFTGTATPSGIGFAFDIAHTATWPGLQLIQVRVQGTDVDGNALDTTYSFTTQNLDTTAPTLTAQTPAPGATNVALASNINFTVTDDLSGVNLSTVIVRVNVGAGFVIAYTGGAFQSGFTGSTTVNGLGYDFVVNPNVDFLYNATIQVRVQASDNNSNALDTTYSFATVVDVTPPFVTAATPASGATNVALNSNVALTVQDAVSGVVLSSITIKINGVNAYTSSAFQAGFSGTATPSGLGYAFNINPAVDFSYNATIPVRVQATDNAGNSLDTTYSFQTVVDVTPPFVTGANPASGATNVLLSSNVFLTIQDAVSGVVLSSVTIKINGVNAYTGSAFQSGFAGTATPNGLGYDFDINPTSNFSYNATIPVRAIASDNAGNSLDTTYSFQTPVDVTAPFLENRVPASGAINIAVNSNVAFRVSDAVSGVNGATLRVYVAGVLAYDATGSGFQAGFSGSVTPVSTSYDVVINPSVDFGEADVIAIHVVVSDFASNELDTTYSFTTIDTQSPTFSNLFPADESQDGTYESTLVSFRADDVGGFGVDQATLNVKIKNGPSAPFQDAIVNGVFFSPYNGGSSAIVALGVTGIDVTIDRTNAYVFNNTVTVVASISDTVGNTAEVTWSFSTAPTPAEPSDEPPLETVEDFPFDASRFMVREIRKNDLEGSPRPGTEFLLRYFEGINRAWQHTVSRIQKLPELWDAVKIEDAHLKYLKSIVGWTESAQLKKITDAIDDIALRRLIAVSGRMWKTRGPESSIIDVLSLLTIARCRIWNWFDFRWVLDETELGEEHQGRDPWMIDLPSSVEAELLIDQSTLFNLATGNAVSCTTPLALAGAVEAGQVFRIKSGPQNGYQAAILSTSGSGPTTINFVQDPNTNGITGAFASVEWEIVDDEYAPTDEYRSNLRIVDDGTLDRTLVKRVLRLMRATGERFDITYLSFLDVFSIVADDSQWEPYTSSNLTVEDGLLKLTDTANAESTFAVVQESNDWTQYIFAARVRGTSNSAGARWGVIFYRSTGSNYYAFLIDTVNQELILRKVVAGVPTTVATVLLNAISFPITADLYYTLRVTIVDEGATNRIQLFVDGFLLLSTTDAAHSEGSVGFMHDANAKIEVDEVEVIEVSKGTDTLELNEFP